MPRNERTTLLSVPTLTMGISDVPLRLSIGDARTITDPAVIGDSTDDDDRVWPIRAADDMVKWKKEGMPQDVIQAALKRAS